MLHASFLTFFCVAASSIQSSSLMVDLPSSVVSRPIRIFRIRSGDSSCRGSFWCSRIRSRFPRSWNSLLRPPSSSSSDTPATNEHRKRGRESFLPVGAETGRAAAAAAAVAARPQPLSLTEKRVNCRCLTRRWKTQDRGSVCLYHPEYTKRASLRNSHMDVQQECCRTRINWLE